MRVDSEYMHENTFLPSTIVSIYETFFSAKFIEKEEVENMEDNIHSLHPNITNVFSIPTTWSSVMKL